MKKAILGLILTVLMIMPFSVFAQEKVNVYFFHGDGCPHCADAETFFNSLDESEKEKFELVKYEVWYSEENAELMQKISDMRNDNANGVPYIIIGDNKWIGYSSYYDAEYEKNPSLRYDVMDEYELLKDTISTNDNTDVYDYDDTDYDNDKDYEGDIEEFLDSHIPQFLIGSGLILVAIAGLILLVPIVVVIIIIVLVTRKKK